MVLIAEFHCTLVDKKGEGRGALMVVKFTCSDLLYFLQPHLAQGEMRTTLMYNIIAYKEIYICTHFIVTFAITPFLHLSFTTFTDLKGYQKGIS